MQEQELWDLQLFTATSISGINLGTPVLWLLIPHFSSYPCCCYSTDLLVTFQASQPCPEPTSHLNTTPIPSATLHLILSLQIPLDPLSADTFLTFAPLLYQIPQCRASFLASLSWEILFFHTGSAQSAPVNNALLWSPLSVVHAPTTALFAFHASSGLGLVSICRATNFLRAELRVIHFPLSHSTWHKAGAHRCLVNDPDLRKFACRLLLLFFKVYIHHILPEDSMYHPREDVKHVWGPCHPGIHLWFSKHRRQCQEASHLNSRIFVNELTTCEIPKHHSPLNRRYISAHHICLSVRQLCLDVTIQQYNVDWL